MKSLVVVGLLAGPSLAAPDDESPFVTMFHHDGATKVDIDAAYVFVNHDDSANPTNLYRGDLFAQYVDPTSGLGGYATVPFTHSRDSMATYDAAGGLELGGLLVRKFDVATLVVHGGLVLPTASTEMSGLVGMAGSVIRLPELYATIPAAITLRTGISPVFHTAPLLVRLDLNLDANVSTRNTTASPGVELDAGMGYSNGPVAVMAELTSVVLTVDTNSLTYVVGAVSARYDLGKVKPYVAVSIPIDDGARQIMKAGVTIGLSATP